MPDSALGQLRILHVAEAFGGGLFEMVRIVAERGARAGANHTIAYGRRPETPVDPRKSIDPSVGLVALDWRRRSPLTQLTAARELRRLSRELRPDVVHLHSSFAGAVGVPAMRGLAPLLFTPHSFASSLQRGSSLRRAGLRQLERVIVRGADTVGAVSRSEAETARQLGARQVVCVQNGIPELDQASWPEPLMRTFDRPRVIAAGRLIEQRRPLECARILSSVRDIAEVAWIGGGGPEGKLKREATSALTAIGAPPSGWLPRQQVLTELRRSAAYLHWTAWDGQALSLLEAMACDVVAVASDLPPNRELLDPRQLCATESEAVALLHRVIADPGFAAQLRAAQRERAALHSAASMADGWNSVYRELALAHRR
jgi:glycosyltransferase involved in cell wall biosynthesis